MSNAHDITPDRSSEYTLRQFTITSMVLVTFECLAFMYGIPPGQSGYPLPPLELPNPRFCIPKYMNMFSCTLCGYFQGSRSHHACTFEAVRPGNVGEPTQ